MAKIPDGCFEGQDGKLRCPWCISSEIYQNYHDTEWGVPVYDDRKQFEFLLLEGFQAGLSWSTILNKRLAFKKAFRDYDPEKIARFGQRDFDRLMNDTGIVRNRLKIKAAISNAQGYLEIMAEKGSFSDYLWDFIDGKPIVNRFKSMSEVPPKTPQAEVISKALKKRGFNFVGPTIIYAHMQATGMVNDHLVDCFRHAEIASEY